LSKHLSFCPILKHSFFKLGICKWKDLGRGKMKKVPKNGQKDFANRLPSSTKNGMVVILNNLEPNIEFAH